MLEKCASKINWDKIAGAIRPCVRVWNISPGSWITLVVLLGFGLLFYRAQANRDDRRPAIAAAYGAATTFYGPAQLSHDGSKLLYVATTKNRSCALYLYDLTTRQTQEIVVERDGLGAWGDEYELRCWSWSADDRYFLYTLKDKLVVCLAGSATPAAELPLGQNAVSQLVWLGTDRFAFVNQKRLLGFAQRQPGGVWNQFSISRDEDLTSLTATSSNTVAWLQNGLICHFNLDEYNQSTQPRMGVSPNATISWSHNVWGFDRALPLKSQDLPVRNIFAGLILASNWNDSWAENAATVKTDGVTVNGLYDHTGARTTAGLTYAAYNGGSLVPRHIGADADGTFNRELLNGFLRAGEAKWHAPVTNAFVALTNLPYPSYDAVVYFGAEVERRKGRITDGTTSYYFSTMGPAAVNGVNALFAATTQTNADAFPRANCAFFPGLTNPNPVFTSLPMSGNDQWLGISAIQLIQSSNVFLVGDLIPPQQTITQGQPAAMNVLAGGRSPHFQWRRDGTMLPGATNAQLSLAAVKAGDAGYYDVIVANDFNSVTSRPAQLVYRAESPVLAGQKGKKTVPKVNLPAFLPVPTNGLALWLDAATLQQSNQTPVVKLKDLSPNHNDAVEYGHAPAFNAPDSVAGLNDHGTIEFSFAGALTNSTGLKTTRPIGIAGSQPRTIFAMMRRHPKMKGMLISLGDCGMKGQYCGLCDQEHALYLPAGMGTDNALPSVPAKWNILTMVYDGSAQKGFVNGVLKGESSFAMNTPDTAVELGLRQAKSGDARQSGASDGDFAELLIYDRALEAAEQQQVENYLAVKWLGSATAGMLDPMLWVKPPVGRITDLSAAPGGESLLISSQSGPATTLWNYDLNGTLDVVAKGISLQSPQWVATHRLAFLRSQSGHQSLVLYDAAQAAAVSLFPHGDIRWFTAAGRPDQLLFFGSVSNEPANGLWLYNLASQRLQSLVAYSDQPAMAARKVVPFSVNLKPGVNCLVYPPSKISRTQKYPLVITDTLTYDPIHGPMFQSGLADCGAYVAIVERNSWYGGIDQWPTNVLELYHKLKSDPAIDANRIYLYGASAETRYLSELVEATPGLWRGIILLNPSQLPDFSKSSLLQKRPRILISAGSEEHAEERLKNYQTKALQWGVIVDYWIAPGEAHRFIGKAAKQPRLQKVRQFVFEE